jgi:hypothetical protein
LEPTAVLFFEGGYPPVRGSANTEDRRGDRIGNIEKSVRGMWVMLVLLLEGVLGDLVVAGRALEVGRLLLEFFKIGFVRLITESIITKPPPLTPFPSLRMLRRTFEGRRTNMHILILRCPQISKLHRDNRTFRHHNFSSGSSEKAKRG